MKHVRIHFPTIDSTHAYAHAHAGELLHGTIVTADVQTHGVGRAGRTWITGARDSLLLSMVLKDVPKPDAAKLLTPLMAMAALGTLADCGLTAGIKWPNDIMVRERKIAGILSCAAYCLDAISHSVVSVGLNVCQGFSELAAIDRPATSLFAETGKRMTPELLLEMLLAQFDERYAVFAVKGFAPHVGEWRAAQLLMGKTIRLMLGHNEVEGEVTAFGEDGTIALKLSGGQTTAYQMGEVVKVY